MAGQVSPAALAAAAWVVNMENGPERSRLYNGHMARRREAMDAGSYGATDNTEADAWLIEQWEASNVIQNEDIEAVDEENEDPCCEECVAWRTGEAAS